MAGMRVGKTADGRYVAYDDPEAAFLAYTEHDDVPSEVAAKMRKAPQDKQAAKPRDKSRGPSSTPKAADVRAWAEGQGIDLPKRGPVPEEVMDAYLNREE